MKKTESESKFSNLCPSICIFRFVLVSEFQIIVKSITVQRGVQNVFALRIIATSQMHPTHARKTFPCFDEPAMKAVFYITLIHPPGTVALSNGMERGQFSLHVSKQTCICTNPQFY